MLTTTFRAGRPKFDMAGREPGHYWVCWSDMADREAITNMPAPLLGHWDGKAWWFPRVDRYFFDAELVVLGERLIPPRAFDEAPMALAR